MHNAKGRTARRTVVMTASGAMLATAATAGVVGGTTVAADAGTVKEGYTYTCKASAGGTGLGKAKVRVQVRTKLPAKVRAGKTIARRPIALSMRLPERLRKAATEQVEATHVSAKVHGAAMGVRIGKLTRKARIGHLKAPKAKIPAESPWKVTAKGKLAAIQVPKRTKADKVRLKAPKRFHAAAKLYRADDTTVRAELSCKGPKKRAFGSVKIVG